MKVLHGVDNDFMYQKVPFLTMSFVGKYDLFTCAGLHNIRHCQPLHTFHSRQHLWVQSRMRFLNEFCCSKEAGVLKRRFI